MIRIVCLAFVLCGLVSAKVIAVTDEEIFMMRVASCKTESCLVNASYLFLGIRELTRVLKELREDYPGRRKVELELARMRGQLNDPDIEDMFADGRWEAMTEVEKRDWTRERWGPDPKNFEN